jgi:hypothetical protein
MNKPDPDLRLGCQALDGPVRLVDHQHASDRETEHRVIS